MSKVLVPVLIGAALIGAAFLTGGASLVPTLTTGATATVAVAGGEALSVATLAVGTALSTTAIGASLLVAGALTVLSGVSSALQTPKVSAAQLSRLNPTLVTETPRKIVFGPTAMALDTRYIEPSGTNQEYFDYIVAAASHAVNSIDAIWFENQVAWTAAGGVDPFYAGYLTVDIRTEGTAANAIPINGGANWGSSCRLTGCAYVHFRIKRSGASSSTTSPLASGLPGRVTIIGTGAKVYDPRRDSTVGGSGSHRYDDQTTWQYADGTTILGNNPALQSLWYKLGWRINGKVAVGKGLPPSRIDLASYIVAANLCDEAVTLAAGGTQRRYETAGIFSEADATLTVFDTICTACGGSLTDTNGKLGLEIAHNDLSGSLTAFDDSDVLGEFTYDPCPSLHTTVNIVRGQWTDPSDASLYQLADVPEQSIASPDGIDRSATVQLGMVQDVNRAQRIYKQILERAQFQGTFTATFGIRALGVKRGQVVKLTFAPLGFTAKLFRVMSQTIVVSSGQVAMVLREEDALVYQWDASELPSVVASPPVLYDPRNDPSSIDYLANSAFLLVDGTARIATETRSRFDPLFWTTNFPNTMIAATRATAADEVTLDATFFEAGQLVGLIWESADNYDHPTTSFDTKRDYRGCTLTFRLQLSAGIQALGDTNGPTLTIEGRDASGIATTWYVLLGNTHGTSGTSTDADVVLDFDSLPGGYDGTGSVYCGDVDRMFISMVPSAYSPGSTTKLGSPVAGTMILSNLVASGSNATLTCGLGAGGVHEVRMTNGFDDTYNVAPDRIVRNCQLLGYKNEFNHYVGMSHYFQWLWSSGESRYIAQDVALPLNTPALLWHTNLAAALSSAGMKLIVSLSYEMLNSFAPAAWRQLDGDGNPALTGWVPPSTLLSPCNATAMAYLARVAGQLAGIADAAGLPVAFQIGEPWYWIDPTTNVPFFYDSATTAAYTTATGLSAPAIATMTATMSAAQLAYLDWLGTRLAASVVAMHAAVRATYPAMTSLVLLYLPQLINTATPEAHRVNLPPALAYPAVDILQLEDYDFVIAGREDLSATGRGKVEQVLGYPRSRQHYFSGFALYRDTSNNIWRNSTTAMTNAYQWGIFPVFVWAYTQVMRDGYVPRLRAAPSIATRDLADVKLAPIAADDGQVLRYNVAAARWLPADAAALATVPEVQLPTLNSPWINYGAGFLGARYYKTAEGVVVVEGLIQATSGSPTTGVTLFTLLPGFRPSGNLVFTTANGGGSGRLDVDSDGSVVMQSGNTAFTSLSLSFLAA